MTTSQFSMTRLCLTVFAFLAISVKALFAVPAYPYPVEYKQPDGSVVTILLSGDEFVRSVSTVDGYTLMANAEGGYEYAVLDVNQDLKPSGILAQNVAERNFASQQLLTTTQKGLAYSASQLNMLNQIKEVKKKAAGKKAFPTSGSRKLVCILMGYKDLAFTKTKAQFESLFNQVNYSVDGATGSVKDYYNENSHGKLDLSVTIAGPYTADNNMSYYGRNSSGNDANPRALVSEAVRKADADVNYADFDNDNDGSVDGIYVIYAGYGEEAGASSNAIWAHAWSIPRVTLDGKRISRYSCSAELRGNSGSGITRIGVICHEFGHVLGAPDYYDTNYDTGGRFDGTGRWDLMAAGTWNNGGATPAHHNAYTKVKVYNWATAEVLNSTKSVDLKDVVADNTSFYQVNTATTGEYFIMENRQQKGFDAKIPGHGLMIYHVHRGVDDVGNSINATYPQRMYPVCASATSNPTSSPSSYGTINSAGCAFPGTSKKTSFTDATTPSAKSWAGEGSGMPITNITESGGVITFDIEKSTVVVPEEGALTAGVAAKGTISSSNTSDHWFIDVPSGVSSMRAVLTCGNDDFDLYGKSGSAPTTSNYDWRGYTSGGEDVTTNNPRAGRHYLLVQRYSGYGSYELTVTFTRADGSSFSEEFASSALRTGEVKTNENLINAYSGEVGVLNIVLDDLETVRGIQVVSLSGKVAYVSSLAQSNLVRVNDLAPGYYLVKVLSGNKLTTKKVFVN